jgi:HD-GYP domain-containing protein (c-di-GMP phosphodiesterase class II)
MTARPTVLPAQSDPWPGLGTIEGDPELQEQLARSRTRLVEAPDRREQTLEILLAGGFVVAAALLFLLSPPQRVPLLTGVVLVAAYALALRVEFEVGSGYTVPTIAVLVPMLFMLPPAVVPLCAVAGHAAIYAVGVHRGRRSAARLPVVLGQGWNALGAAIVFALHNPGPPGWEDAPLVAAAYAAYVTADAAASSAVDHYGHREPIAPLLRSAGWIYAVDLLLVPLGFTVAIAARGHAAALAVLLPQFGLLAVFAGERRRRIDGALELSRAYRGTAMLLGDVVEQDDAYTGSHSRDVVELARGVGQRLGLNAVGMRNLEFGALLHDVGKIAVPKAIINKPGPLDDAEWAIMRRHTIDGQRMLENVGGVLTAVGAVVRSSHEHFDGSGYPDGLAGEAIPIEARICTVCDAFNAMTTDRSYRRGMPVNEALAELRRCAGTQFDPGVVDALIAHLAATEVAVDAADARRSDSL